VADVYGAVVCDGGECAEYSDGAEVLDLDGLGLEHRCSWVCFALKGNGSRGGGERALKLSTSSSRRSWTATRDFFRQCFMVWVFCRGGIRWRQVWRGGMGDCGVVGVSSWALCVVFPLVFQDGPF